MRLLSLLPRIGIFAILCALAVPPAPAPAQVSIGVGVSVNFGPPAIPVYVQPPCPRPNYIWTPGYWQYGPYGYFWVPGAWVGAPHPGYLWTPGYWGYAGGGYGWHAGYWGRHVGFYGGVNYGFGFFGVGFVGGGWYGNTFRYNTAVVNVNRTVIRNVYVNKTVIVNNYYPRTRTSYYGGPGGLTRGPLASERAYANQTRIPALPVQRQHVQVAQQNRNYLASVNHGRPSSPAFDRPLSATNRPSDFAPVRPADRPATAGTQPYRATHPQYEQNHMGQPNHMTQPNHMNQPNHMTQPNHMGQNHPEAHHAPGNGGGHQVHPPQNHENAHPHDEHPEKH